MLKAGEVAPEFELQSDSGDTVRLSDLRGKKVILYFYPKDDTPGCVTEACEFRDHMPDMEREGALILGISPDSLKSHQKFKSKYELPFTLLADPDHAVAESYGAWGEKKMYGKVYQGILRTTYLIDEQGKIEQVFERVKPKGHSQQVLSALSGG